VVQSGFSRLSTVFIVFPLYFISANCFAVDLFGMLKGMSDADQKQNYQGTFILRKSDDLSALRVIHGVGDSGDWESLESLDGEYRKVVRHDNQVVSVYPERKLVTIRHNDTSQSLHPQLPDNIDQLENFYTMTRLDDDRIADHPALVVDLLPKDHFRYGYRYWVDENTGMLLRCDLLTDDNTIVEQMMFTSLDYLATAPAQAFDLQQFQQFKQQSLDEPEINVQQNAAVNWSVKHLPEGFELTKSSMRYLRPALAQSNNSLDSDPPDLLQLVYSDGLASVSVFIEKNAGNAKHLQGAISMGAVNAFGNAVGDYFATVVGVVPVKTVQLMAESIVKVEP
jgi:sigma-E factor negative regulatory protein RseB